MKLNENFIVYDNGTDHILMDTSASFSGLVHCNATTAFILECLKQDISEQELVQKLLSTYDVTEEILRPSLQNILEQLQSIHALEL